MAKISHIITPLFRSGVLNAGIRLPVSCCCLPLHRQPQNHARLALSRYVASKAEAPVNKTGENQSKQTLIYTGPLKMKIHILKLFTLASSAMIMPVQYVALTQYDITHEPLLASVLAVASVLQVCTPLFIHYICSKYVVHMYHNEEDDTYTAVTYSIIATEKRLTFKIDDVEMPKIEIFCTAVVKKKPMFFDPEHFTDIDHYRRLMKYDLPIDLSLDKEEKTK